MSDWKNRTKYDKITQEVIAHVPDDLLAWAMFDYIRLRIGSDYERTLEVLAELPLGFAVIYHLFALDAEIRNGGFNQYFFNGLDRDAAHQFRSLELIGAVKHRQILQKAFTIHAQEKENEELQHRYSDQTIESFLSTYGMTKLDECDDAWYALEREFGSAIVEFIRAQPELFVT